MNAEQAKLKNINDMAFGFSAMTRVFEKKAIEEIVKKLKDTLPQIASVKNEADFQNLHDGFCQRFVVKTAERKSKKDGQVIKPSGTASYGQGAKVLDVALKVYVYYCHLPDAATADRTMKWLNAAIDTNMLKYLKKYDKGIPDAEAKVLDKGTYDKLQALVRKDIGLNFPIGTLPVQWDDIMWRKLNDKDKKIVVAKITGRGADHIYKTGIEKGQEILEITLPKREYYKHNIPWNGEVKVELVIGHGIYRGTLNLKRKDKVPWISSVIYDSRGKKMALRTPLIASGCNKTNSVNLQININKKEIAIC